MKIIANDGLTEDEKVLLILKGTTDDSSTDVLFDNEPVW